MPEYGMTSEAQDRGLRAIFGRTLVMVLTRGGQEINDSGYEPVSVRLSEPQGLGNSTARIVTNREDIRFGPWTQDATGPVDGWELRDSAGTALASGRHLQRETLLRGQEGVIRARTIILGFR